jgi:hypothetical protein
MIIIYKKLIKINTNVMRFKIYFSTQTGLTVEPMVSQMTSPYFLLIGQLILIMPLFSQ